MPWSVFVGRSSRNSLSLQEGVVVIKQLRPFFTPVPYSFDASCRGEPCIARARHSLNAELGSNYAFRPGFALIANHRLVSLHHWIARLT